MRSDWPRRQGEPCRSPARRLTTAALPATLLALAATAAASCGGSSSVDEGATDAGGEVTAPRDAAPEGEAPVDAGADVRLDAGHDPVDAAKRYCATVTPPPKFCDDFDDGDVSNDWNFFTVTPGGSVAELDTDASTSAPASFHVIAAPLVSGDQENVHLRRTLIAPVTHVRLAFSARFPVTAVPSGSVGIASLDVSTNHFFTLNLRDADPDSPGPSLEETTVSGTQRYPLTKAPAAGAWTRIVVDLDLSAGEATVTFDGDKVLDGQAITKQAGGEATVRVGAVYVSGPTDAFEASFDDVVLDF